MQSFSFTTSLTGTALDNLPPNTDITSTITSPIISSATGLFEPNVPQQDAGGFAIGGPFGLSVGPVGYIYFNVISGSVSVLIGTDATGHITSWNITEGIFASYPAITGGNEPPTDFYCDYSASTTSGGDTLTLTADHDVGFCQDQFGAVSGIGAFSGSSGTTAVPAPIAGSGLPGLIFASGGLLAW